VRTAFLVAISAAISLSSSGCGSTNDVWVTCEILRNGRPFSVPETHSVQVTFYALETKDENGKVNSTNEPYAAARRGDGKFEVPGPEGRGIPPGKYRIAVIHKPKGTNAAPKPKSKREVADREFDFLRDRFGPQTSPIVRTIDTKSSQVVIDLDSPAG
jgi:hypothetical protein